MTNPFSKIELKYWPDFLLAISGVSFVMVLGALIANTQLPGGTLGWVTLFGGFLIFGIAGKIAHYRRHDKAICKWVSAWRNNWLSNVFVITSILLLITAGYIFWG